jgi:isopentenyl-diphosphate delta-isomerase type 1
MTVSASASSSKDDDETATPGAAYYGANMDQDALMESDMLVAVDENDHLVPLTTTPTVDSRGSSGTTRTVLSKKEGHKFTAGTPRGVLHRAFSLFLFDERNRLLLTKRAASKITFPNVWTNTVCSHPLYGMTPNEADVVPDAYPSFPGIKHAAIRKCYHELGIAPQFLDHSAIRFITRFHYWAADTVTYGPNSPWGEHEVDYILFLKTDQSSDPIPIVPHEDEVSDHKYVTVEEFKAMRADPDLLWSPWFLGILERGGLDWWANLDDAVAGSYTNDRVTFFDPPPEHQARYNLPDHDRNTGVLSSSASL